MSKTNFPKTLTRSMQRLQRLLRAYPSLNLRIDVDHQHHQAHVNLPGLRYDDIDYTGQPNMWRLMNMCGRAEHSAFYNADSFLKYVDLQKLGISTVSKAITMEVGSHFYEVTTPKAPIQLKLNVIGIADTSFTTCISMMVGGRIKPSIIIKNLNVLMHRDSGLIEQVPEWWRMHFSKFLPTFPEKPVILSPPENIGRTFSHHLTVPYSDTDTSGRTRHPMYLRYFIDNMSIASDRGFYRKFPDDLHEYQVRRIFAVKYDFSKWGDALTVETFENPDEKELRVHCFVVRNGQILWYGCVEFFPTKIT